MLSARFTGAHLAPSGICNFRVWERSCGIHLMCLAQRLSVLFILLKQTNKRKQKQKPQDKTRIPFFTAEWLDKLQVSRPLGATCSVRWRIGRRDRLRQACHQQSHQHRLFLFVSPPRSGSVRHCVSCGWLAKRPFSRFLLSSRPPHTEFLEVLPSASQVEGFSVFRSLVQCHFLPGATVATPKIS